VHAIARGIGTTDAAALGALAALVRAGLATLEPVTDHEGHRGCAFRLHLPPGVEVRDSDQGDAVAIRGELGGPSQQLGGLTDPPQHYRCSAYHSEER
jgi:hypothetical protein